MIEVLTYEQILDTMKDTFKQESGCDVDDASDVGIKLRVLAGQLYSHSKQMEFVCKQLFLKTATGNHLDNHAKMRGLERREATKAHGIVRFGCEEISQTDVLIPKGTKCAILDEDSEIYETTEDVILQKGQQFVDVNVIAIDGGTKSNASKGVVTTLINPPQTITSVTNISEMTGGSEKEFDDSLRNRLYESYRNISNGANKQFYVEVAMSNPKVISANIISCARGAGTVDVVFESSEQQEEEIDKIKKQLDIQLNFIREIGTSAKSFPCINELIDIVIYIKISHGADKQTVINEATQKIRCYLDKLKVGENLIVAELSNILYTTNGIENYSIVTPKEDTSICGRNKLKINNLSITDDI